MELLRVGLLSATVGIFAVWLNDDDDDSFIGQMTRKLMREGLSLIGALNPRLWLAEPRAVGFLSDIWKIIEQLAALEEYKTSNKKYGYQKGDLKAVQSAKNTFTPRAIRYIFDGIGELSSEVKSPPTPPKKPKPDIPRPPRP